MDIYSSCFCKQDPDKTAYNVKQAKVCDDPHLALLALSDIISTVHILRVETHPGLVGAPVTTSSRSVYNANNTTPSMCIVNN